ncbi:MAG: DNA recombination protein RmuC [Pseudomonadota bacterium]
MINELLTELGAPPGEPIFWIALALAAALSGALVQWRRAKRRAARASNELESLRIAHSAAQTRASEGESLREALDAERTRTSALEVALAAKEASFAERERSFNELNARFETAFKATTSDLLDGAHKAFLERAGETFKRYETAASADGERRRKALDDLLKPVSETLVRYEKGLSELRAEQTKSRGELAGQIGALAQSTANVSAETNKLAAALRAGPKTRGRWGEEQLRNVVEIAGMSAYVDFQEQSSYQGEDGRKQPDMVVRLPGDRRVAVDSKVSLGAYLDAMEAETDDARAQYLARHADDLWAHVKALSAKDYAAAIRDALDYTVMFVPGENYFSAALEARPQLYQDAFDRKVLIASPTILIAMLKSAALNWRQEKMTEHAQAVASMAKDLYDSLQTMTTNLSQLGNSLKSSVKKYNDVIGGFDGRVLPRARRFADYEIPGIEAPIKALEQLDETPRTPRHDDHQPSLALPDDPEENAA